MKTQITATRLSGAITGCDYTVMVRTGGAGTVDVSLWLNDEEARSLGQQLLAASEPNIPATTAEAA
jgi:hypothetical protein